MARSKTILDSGNGKILNTYLRRGWTVAWAHRRLIRGGIRYTITKG